jgi:gliding motility-associated-like protein
MKKILILSFLFLSLFSKASHIAGGQITYKCLGNNVYEVKLTYFWDCNGGFNPGTSQTLNVAGCTNSLTMVVNQSTLTPGDGIQADGLCANSGLTTCKKRIDYIGTITLPSACNNWVFSLGSCCRGGNITNITGGTSASYYHFATLDNTIVTCNNSPDISIGILPNFCVNQSACFNLGATEPDGHTLSYAFISAYQTATTFVAYSAGFTGTSPIAGITIDPNTGQINLTPTLIGDFVITVQITERDANGNIIGTIMRDFQVIVTNCTNQTVTCGQGSISNVTSGTVPGGNANTLQICENIPFCFDVTFTDPDINDSVKISSPNIASSLPGSTMVMSYTAGVKNKVKATICWTPPAGSSGLNTNFVLIVKDNSCPVPGTQVLNYFIDVLPATSAGPNQTICGTQAASVTATGSSTVFTWSDLSGTSIPVGPAFSCNPCNNPVIKPAITSTYVVTNVGGGVNCKNKDTLIITVVPDFTLTAGAGVANSCLNTSVQFTSNVNPAGAGYTYTWSPTTALTSTNAPNTSATYSIAGSYVYTVTAISSLGCAKQSNMVPFVIAPVTIPVFTVVPTNTTVCLNTAVPLSVNFGTSPPSVCGLASSGCVSPSVKTVGNGFQVNSNTGSPTPYSNYWCNSHVQMLYLASELSAAGVVAGKLSSIGFKVNSLNSFNTALPNFTIKIKCTSATSLTTTFDNAGLFQVFNGTYMPTVGINTHNFSQAYEWDGVSNILVDICYDRIPAYVSSGATSVIYMTTAYTSVIYQNSDGTNLCGSASGSTSSLRANTYFGNCSSVPNPNSFTYSWLPTTGLSNPSISNPIANLSASIQYSVVVTPTAATTCSNVNTTSLTVVNPITPTITAVPTLCSNASTFTLSALPAGGTWSLTTATSTSGVFKPSLATIGNNTVTYTYGGTGCSQTTTATIVVERFVPSTITGTINPLCIPSTTINLATTLTTSTLGVGVWSGNGVTGTTFNPNTAGAGTHTLTYATNSSPTASLCPSSSTITVNINFVPQPSITSAGPFCTNSSTIALSGTPTGGTWSGSGINAGGVLTPSLATVGNNTYTYTVGSATCSAANNSTISIEQYVPSTITGTINPLCLPSATINLATALPTSTIGVGVWSGNGVTGTIFDPVIAGAGTQTLTYNTNSSPTASLCPSSSIIEVNINSVAQPAIAVTGPFCNNFSAITLSATPTGGVWLGNGVSTSGVLTPSLAMVGNNTYTYTVGSATCSAVNNTTISIEQYVPSTITGTINPLCLPSATINLATALTTSTLGVGVWSGNGVSGTIFDPVIAGTGTQTLTYSTNSSPTTSLCPSSSIIEVNLNSVAQPTISATGPFCTNYSAITLSATPTGGIWVGTGMSTNGILTPSLAMVGNNTYTYTVGTATCYAVNNTTISIEQYVPSTITGTINAVCISNPIINLPTTLATSSLGIGVWAGNGVTGMVFDPAIAGAGTHTLTYSTNSLPTITLCPSISSIEVSVISIVQPTISAAGPYCDNYAVQTMTVNPTGGTWSALAPLGQFSPNPNLVGTNTLLYTLINGPCTATTSVNIDVIHFVPATIIGALGPYCIYDPAVNLQPIAQFAGGVWTGTGVSASSFTPSAAGAGVHTITYSTNPSLLLNCGSTETISILVNPKPEANAVPSNLGGCNYPWPVDFSTTTVNTGVVNWDFGDGSPNVSGFIVNHIFTKPGTYIATLTYTDIAGCMDTTQATSAVTIYSVPDAAFEPSLDVTTVINAEITFTNHTSDLPNNTYTWDFGGLDGSHDISPTYLFVNSGEYFVSLIAVSPNGCQDTTIKKITINPDVVLYVPNAFTPGNSDGLNDVFQIFLPPTGVDYSTFSLSIYDRWGELVYNTNDVNVSWTGAKHNSGSIMKQDTYVWKIIFQDENKKFYQKMGHVTLLHK